MRAYRLRGWGVGAMSLQTERVGGWCHESLQTERVGGWCHESLQTERAGGWCHESTD